MARRRSRWLVFAGQDGDEQAEPLARSSSGGSAAGQQEAQLVLKNVKAARAKQAQSKAWQAITGLVDVAVYHKSDLLDAPKAAAELAKLLHLPASKRKGAQLRQLQTLSRHLVLPDDCSKHPHAAAIWQLCHQRLQLVQKQAAETVMEQGMVAKHWVWLLTGDVSLPGQLLPDESSTDGAAAVRGILRSSEGGAGADSTRISSAGSKGSQVPCFSLLNPGAHRSQPQPVELVAATSSVQLAIMDVSCYREAVERVQNMEQQKLHLREALLAPGNKRTEQQLRQIRGLLQVHPVLQHLPESVKASAAGMLGYLTAQPGTVLYDSGDSMDAWYIILSGKLRVAQPHALAAAGEQPTSSSGASNDSTGNKCNSINGGKTFKAQDELADPNEKGQISSTANASPGNTSICLMPGLTGALEQPPLTAADISSSKERHFESRAICMTCCELAVLGRTEFATLAAQQQDALINDRLKVLRDQEVFAKRTAALAQRVAEVCTDVQAAPGALIMVHCAAAAAVGADDRPASPSSAEPRNTGPAADSSSSASLQHKRQRMPLIAGRGYAFVAAGECQVVCKVLVDCGKQQAQALDPTATAGRSRDTAAGWSAGARTGSSGPAAARPGSPAKFSTVSSSVAVSVPLLQLGPGDMLAAIALGGCGANEVLVVAHSSTHLVWLPESMAGHHLGPQGVADLSEAAQAQSSRLQQLLADAVAARQDMLQNSKDRGQNEARQAMKQCTRQPQQQTSAPLAQQGLEGSGSPAGQQSRGSMMWAAGAPITEGTRARMSVAQTAELAAQLLEQQVGGASSVSTPARSPDTAADTQGSAKAAAGGSPARLRAMSLLSLGILSDGLDLLNLDTAGLGSKSSSNISPPPLGKWEHDVPSGSKQLGQGASSSSATAADVEAAGLPAAVAPESASSQQSEDGARSSGSSPTAGTRQQQQQHLESPQSMPAPRARISTAVKKQMLVAPASSPQLLPHTRNRSSTVLCGVHDPATGGVELDPPRSSMSLQDAGFGGYTGFAGAGSLAEQLQQQVSSSPRVVVLPALAAAAGGAQGSMGRNSAVSSKEVLQGQPASRSSMSAAAALTQQESAPADGRRPRRSKSDINSSATRDASSLDSRSQQTPALIMPSASQQQQQRPGAPLSSLAKHGSAPVGSLTSPNTVGSRVVTPGSPSAVSGFSSRVATAASGWRKLDADLARLADPMGPLELDPAAPPLGNLKLSRPDQTDMEYALHRWSQRWQSERARLAAATQQDQLADP